MPRRTIQRITPQRPSTFDQQFWPVIVALTVLCGIAMGAVLTLLQGPWMWGSLLLLPTLAALAILFLFHLDDARLRRSLQLAIILSLAAHMLVLIVAALTNVFANPFENPKREIAKRQPKTIEISDQRTEFIWEQTDPRDTPEPEIETEKQKETTTNVKPQPVPVENRRPEVQPQLTRRETPQRTMPKQGKTLSQLRRQKDSLKPQSSVQSSSQQTVQTRKESQPAESQVAENITRPKRMSNPSDAAPLPVKARVEPNPSPDQPTVAVDSRPQRVQPARQTVDSAPQSSTSAARLTRSIPQIPKIAKRSDSPERRTTNLTRPTEPRPAPRSTNVTRRPEPSRTVRPAVDRLPERKLSPKSEIARAVQRRINPSRQPSVSQPTPSPQPQRRSITDAAVAVSPIPIEQPNRKPSSSQSSSQLNAKTLSVTRSTTGAAGVGVSRNLDRSVGGMTSPAVQASDSAQRRRTESRPTESRMLTSSQSSTSRRSSGASPVPASAIKADSIANAKIAGSSKPSERTTASSAANIDSASDSHRSEVSAEKGSTSVDLGPTKIVADQAAPRRSGGGQPEIGEFNPSPTQRARSDSRQQPSLVAATATAATAPRSLDSAPTSDAMELAERSTTLTRQGGDQAVSAVRDSAITAGALADRGESDLATELTDSRQRARRGDRERAARNEEDEEDDPREGNRRNRIAKAPTTRAQSGFGNSKNLNGPTVADSSRNSDSPSESSATDLQRRATTALPGSGLGRSATSALLQAATSVPVVESGGSQRVERNRPGSRLDGLQPNPLLSKNPGRIGSDALPQLSSSADNLPSKGKVGSSGTEGIEEPASASVSVNRSNKTDQLQGAAFEVQAIDGPAGMADRPEVSLGVMSRPAARDSDQILPSLDSRFRKLKFGGAPALNPDATLAKDAFRKRTPAAMSRNAEPSTEAAIQLGLEFLARHQSPDGSWSLAAFDQQHPQHVNQLNSDTAATGLAVLAFQGAGYNHREFKYARQVNEGLQWLIENQQPDGCLYVDADEKSNNACRLYSHGIAALALTEAYGMTQDPQLKSAAQKALDYIADSQDARKGGWRYFDQPAKRSSDTSVTGWMLMAMQSGQLAGLEVNSKTFDRIDQWLGLAAEPENESLFRYNPFAVDTAGISRMQGRQASVSMTAVGLLMRIYRGWEQDDPRLVAGAKYLVDQQMPGDTNGRVRDTYYWYYATQVLKHVDGPLWDQWNDTLRPLLIESQIKTGEMSGSWHPYNPVPDRWATFGGRLYVTTMNLLSLEVRYRLLPLYQKTNNVAE
jgi:hypothetical protein